MEDNTIVINDKEIIEFFKANSFIEPRKFFLSQIRNYKNNNNTQTATNIVEMPIEDVKKLNDDYLQYVNNRKMLMNCSKEIQQTLNKIKFENFDEFFSKHFKTEKQCYTCDICNNFNVMTKKGLSAHKRTCAKNHSVGVEINDDSDEHEDV